MSVIDELAEHARTGRLTTSMGGREHSRHYPPATFLAVMEAEAQLGFALPPLLRQLYTRVANGGFGPGYGLIGLKGGATDDESTIVDLYHSFRHRPTRSEPWGEKLLPICHWGCSYYSYLDCALPQAPVLAIDEDRHGHGPWGCAFSLHAASFEEWLQRWLDGEDLWNSIGLEGEPIVWFEENAARSPDGA
jgi:hypothetical protein